MTTNLFGFKNNFSKIANIGYERIKWDQNLLSKSVTIAIPTFKRPDLLKIALDSALNQINFDDYCVIVVDNNPIRNCETEKLIESYENHNFIYVKNKINIGMCNNWNRCIEISNSKSRLYFV